MTKQVLRLSRMLTYVLLALLAWTPYLAGQNTDQAQTAGDRAVRRGNSLSTAVGDVVLEMVGQVTNFATTPASSKQVGYLTFIKGVDTIFLSGSANETTARFSFFTEAITTRVISNGPFRIINRVGTTTVYLNNSPNRNFNDLDSFRLGTPIQTSEMRQQVILDTVSMLFFVVNVNTITSSDAFAGDLGQVRMGRPGQTFRTTLSGRLNMPGPPSGYFSGSAVGFVTVDGEDER